MKVDKCELCGELGKLIFIHEERAEAGGLFMKKAEIKTFAAYVEAWNQRQCLCLFKDATNFERTNNIVQIVLSRVLEVVHDITEQCKRKQKNKNQDAEMEAKVDVTTSGGTKGDEKENEEKWTNHEKEELFLLGARVFLINFPLYICRHSLHSTLEDLSKDEVNVLGNYCKLDAEVPLFLLRNVCFFCDNNGIQAIGNLFDVADAELLPINLAHTLVNLIANVRRWLLMNAEITIVIPVRKNVNRYMCRLSDKDLRVAGMQNLTDLLWSAFKEPIESQLIFDRDAMEVTYKYFTCSTLTIRLTGISQINNQITLYNELSGGEGLLEVESGRQKLANWLIEKKFVEHIFGPNLHLEIVKQSQLIVSFLAIENRLTEELIDCMWAAAQLKHCSKQVLDLLILLNRTLCDQPARHLLHLVTSLEPSVHTEQTLTLASALTKAAWGRPAGLRKAVAIPASRHAGNVDDVRGVPVASHAHLDVEFSSGSSSTNEHILLASRAAARAVYVQKTLATGKRTLGQQSRKEGAGRLPYKNKGQGRLKPEHNEDDMDLSCGECDDADHTDSSSSEEFSEKEPNSGTPSPSKRRKVDTAGKSGEVRRRGKGRPQPLSVEETGLTDEEDEEDGDIGDDEEEEEEEGGSEEDDVAETDDGQEEEEEEEGDFGPQQGARDSEQSISEYDVSSGDDGSTLGQQEQSLSKAVVMHKMAAAQRGAARKKPAAPLHNSPRQQHASPASDEASELLGVWKDNIELNTSGELDRHDHLMKEGMSSCEECVMMYQDGEIVGELEQHLRNAGQLGAAGKRKSPIDYAEYLQDIASEKGRNIPTEVINRIVGEEDGASCNSSHISNKSEKNMNDFDGEDLFAGEELNHLESLDRQTPMQQHLANMAASYRDQPRDTVHHRPKPGPPAALTRVAEAADAFSDVCKPGNTLVWDLLQDDVIHKLPEGLAVEAEKMLSQMVCLATEKQIKLRFIEACISNLACHRSVTVSLRLLPKILMSFFSCRGGPTASAITEYAEQKFHMLHHFFDDLVFLTSLPHTRISYKEEVQVRLQFLTCIFSSIGLPENFRLKVEQVDILWNCLACDSECCDDLFTWLLNQARNKDQHSLGRDSLQHIFLNKIPELPPEQMTVTGLHLFTQLCQMARMASYTHTLDVALSEDQLSGMEQLWKIALRARNTDVSLTAVHTLNNYYLNYGSGMLEKEEEFVECCMRHLGNASKLLDQNSESSLTIIQRGLLLLTSHIESFRSKYAFHLRLWSLNGAGIACHDSQQRMRSDKHYNTIMIVLQSGAPNIDRSTLEMSLTDLVGDLRAEVTWWWQMRRAQQLQQQHDAGEVLRVQPEGPLRIITLGQELGPEGDERSLAEQQFKDSQLVFVSLGANRPMKKVDGYSPACYLPSPPRDKLPMMLLLEQRNFEMLFSLLQQLNSYQTTVSADEDVRCGLSTKAYLLSRKVWDLVMMLPSNPHLLESFKQMSVTSWDQLLPPSNPHKLLYGLQIVDHLCQTHRMRSHSETFGGASTSASAALDRSDQEDSWASKFLASGGMQHLMTNILLSFTADNRTMTQREWQQDCLANLLRLMCHIGMKHADTDDDFDGILDLVRESPKKKVQRPHIRGLQVPLFTESFLSLLDARQVIPLLLDIIIKAAVMQCDNADWPLMTSCHIEVVHYAISFLTLWAYSSDGVYDILTQSDKFVPWLKCITIEASESLVRQEACQALYRLCLGKTVDGKTGYRYLLPTLAGLVSFLPDAQAIKSPTRKSEDEKEPTGPSCKDYFWIVSRLVDAVTKPDAIKSWTESGVLDINELTKQVAQCIGERECREKYHSTLVDDGLVGLLSLATDLLKHNPPFKTATEGKAFINEVFECIFALPTPSNRQLPKCKTKESRRAAFDVLVELIKGCVDNYCLLHSKIIRQHQKDMHAPYSWDKWPLEDERSSCGYVGLTNLGATCYMATCMQHLYMIPEARKSVLEAQCTEESKHCSTLVELKRMFAFLMESERKAFNPRNFCRVYTMDHRPLNTGEQKDMTEFFIDLITKLEEMGPDLKRFVKTMFGGIITNNVVSLDCAHVSQTKEEFYTVRCQVADIKNIYESLDEVTVKDMLEGDNMYTCSRCQKKVRAEKRACFRKLPKILCFNTMRYTFNMVTMMKEKVNTHFSFPLHLDMSSYMERNLIGQDKLFDMEARDDGDEFGVEAEQGYEYELIGVTVHTGTAEGGHYYSFILDKLNRNEQGQAKWFLFNDAEVKPWDPAQIAADCFGGEMTSKTYDSVTDKFLDFSFEKTNSAYMLFYERVSTKPSSVASASDSRDLVPSSSNTEMGQYCVDLSPDLSEMIWSDNTHFLQDKNIFDHDYFSFLYQLCGYVMTTLTKDAASERVALLAAQLSVSFVLETLIHAKEKPTMVQWIELLTKQFNSCSQACEWFLQTMADDDWWPQQILIKCPNQMVRQMFQRLVLHVINQLRSLPNYLSQAPDDKSVVVLSESCITRFVLKLLSIIDNGARPNCKYLSEYFAFLLDFAKMGVQESSFLLNSNAISLVSLFFFSHKMREHYVEIMSDSDGDEDEDASPSSSSADKYRPQSFEKMVSLVAVLVESSRGSDGLLHLSDRDLLALIDNSCAFLNGQIYDCINLQDTARLIVSLCQRDETISIQIVSMILESISKLCMEAQPFLKLLLLLMDYAENDPDLKYFVNSVLSNFWNICDCCPQLCLDWLAGQVVRNKLICEWVFNSMNCWVETFIFHSNSRIRSSAAMLLVSLVPCSRFRQLFQSSRNMTSPQKDLISQMTADAINAVHQIYTHLLRLLGAARHYVEVNTPTTNRLVFYFNIMTFCLLSRQEKRMFTQFTLDLWNLFKPNLAEPPISRNHNKQALLIFWNSVCTDCPENVKAIVQNPTMAKNIPFIYILADNDDQGVISFNRLLLPAYYGLLRMCCQQSREFCRHFAQHENLIWALKQIAPFPGQYMAAVEELFRMVRCMAEEHADASEEERRLVIQFRQSTIQLLLSCFDARNHWQSLVTALKILVVTPEDCLVVIRNRGFDVLFETFCTLHHMHHEATACHVSPELIDLLVLMMRVLQSGRPALTERPRSDVREQLIRWKQQPELCQKLLSLLNSYQSPDIRQAAIDMLNEVLLAFQMDAVQILTPLLLQHHVALRESSTLPTPGPYFPNSGRSSSTKSALRFVRPQFNMMLHAPMLDDSLPEDELYETAVREYFMPYHRLVDRIVRVAANHKSIGSATVRLSALVGLEGAVIGMQLFAKLWYEIYQSDLMDRACIEQLCDNSNFAEYVTSILLQYRGSLNDMHIYQFMCTYLPKVQHALMIKKKDLIFRTISMSLGVCQQKLEAIGDNLLDHNVLRFLQRINAEQRAIMLVTSFDASTCQPPDTLLTRLRDIQAHMVRLKQASVANIASQASAKVSTEDGVPAKRQCLDNSSQSGDGDAGGDRRPSVDAPSTSAAATANNGLDNSQASTAQLRDSSGNKAAGAELRKSQEDDKKPPRVGAQPGHATEEAPLSDDGVLVRPAKSDTGVSKLSGEASPSSTAPTGGSQPQGSSSSSSADSSITFTSSTGTMASASSESVTSTDSNSSSGSSGKRPAATARVEGREKPTLVDIIIKNMDTIFSLVRRAKDT